MIGVNKSGTSSKTNLDSIAALTPSGQKVIVLNNKGLSETYRVSIINNQGAVLDLTLEPKSFTTVVYAD